MTKYEHQVSDVSPIDITATYKYDSFGRRIQKNVNGNVINFFWENDTMTYELNASYQPIRKYMTGFGIPGGDSITTCFVKPQHSDAMDDYEGHLEYSDITDWYHIFWASYGQPWYSYIKDQVGTIYKVHSLKTRSIVESRIYDSFGNLINQSGTSTTPLGFQGKYYDAESGLNYFYHRYYNPTIGRFTTEDPIALYGGPNMYEAMGNDTVNYIDPFGMDRIRDLGKEFNKWFGGYYEWNNKWNIRVNEATDISLNYYKDIAEGIANNIINYNWCAFTKCVTDDKTLLRNLSLTFVYNALVYYLRAESLGLTDVFVNFVEWNGFFSTVSVTSELADKIVECYHRHKK